MLSINLSGGFGNILFQTAALEYLGKRFGYDTCYPNFEEHIKFLQGDFYNYNLHTEDFRFLFKNFNWHEEMVLEKSQSNIMRIPFAYNHITEMNDDTELIGYFQSEEFWGGERWFIKELFEPSDFLLKQLKQYDSLYDEVCCAVHVRRGDYLKFPDVYNTVSVDYINRARESLKGHYIEKYLVFSDDLDWCRENLKGSEYHFVDVEKDYLAMFLIGRCHYKIISNSSFSWFGAYLSPIGGLVIAPKRWIIKEDIDDSHVCPYYWKRV